MDYVDKTIEVNVPVQAAYDQLAAFESFPRFIPGVSEVRQLPESHLLWTAEIAGRQVQWNTEITHLVADDRIAWQGTSGLETGGQISFKPLGIDKTEIRLWMAYDAKLLAQYVGVDLGDVRARISTQLRRFKEFVEGQATASAAERPGQSSLGDLLRLASSDYGLLCRLLGPSSRIH